MIRDNDYVKQDLATVDNLMNGKPLPPTTYVIFETGCAPVRDQIRIDIPIIVTKVSYVGAAFPTLKPQGNYLPSLTVTANGTNATTSLVASMDSVIGLDFKNEMPIVITKTIAATVTKAVAAYAVNEAANQQNSLARFGLPNRHGGCPGRRQHRRRTHLDDAAEGISGLPHPHATRPQN